MACKESICKNCFHSYVCEQFNENKDDNNEKCHFFNDHFVSRADVAPKSEIAREIFEEIYEDCFDQFGYIDYEKLADLKKKYEENNR